jgi:hypothetical protein
LFTLFETPNLDFLSNYSEKEFYKNCIYLRRKNKSIGSKTGILIALNSLCEVLHQSSHFFAFYVAATGLNFVKIWLAFAVNALPLFGFNNSLNMLTLSMDRLFGIMAPI